MKSGMSKGAHLVYASEGMVKGKAVSQVPEGVELRAEGKRVDRRRPEETRDSTAEGGSRSRTDFSHFFGCVLKLCVYEKPSVKVIQSEYVADDVRNAKRDIPPLISRLHRSKSPHLR